MAEVEAEQDVAGERAEDGSARRAGGKPGPLATKKKAPSLASAFEALQACPMNKIRPNPMRHSTLTVTADQANGGENKWIEKTPAESAAFKPAKSEVGEVAKTGMKRKRKSTLGGRRRSKGKTGRPAGRPKSTGTVQERTASLLGIPDEVRCKRSDGKDWRCKNRRMDGLGFCEKHASRNKKGVIGGRAVVVIDQESPRIAPQKKEVRKKSLGKATVERRNLPIREGRTRGRAAAQPAEPAAVTGQVDSGLMPERPESGVEAFELMPLETPEHASSAQKKEEVQEASLLDSAVQADDAALIVEKLMDSSAMMGLQMGSERDQTGEAKDILLLENGEHSRNVQEKGHRRLFLSSGSYQCWRVQITLEEKFVDYEPILLDFSKREHYEGELAALNPRSQVPTFVDGDLVVCESGAACQYLDWAYSSRGPLLIPEEAHLRTSVLQRMYESTHYEALHSEVLDHFANESHGPSDNEARAMKKAAFRKELELWEGYLKEKSFLVGDTMTMADIFFYPVLAASVHYGLDLTKFGFPSLAAYHSLMAARTSIAKTAPPLWRESSGQSPLADI